MKRTPTAPAAALAALLALLAVGCGGGETRSPSATPVPQGAIRAARSIGDTAKASAAPGAMAPTSAEVVLTTCQKAIDLVGLPETPPARDASTPCYLVQVRGDFINFAYKGPQPPTPTGVAVFGTVEVETGEVIGLRVGTKPRDLSSLGEVWTLPLAD